MKIKLGVSILLAFLVFLFISQNTDVVMVDFLFWSVEMSLVLMLFIVLGAGVIIGWLLNSYLRFLRNRGKSRSALPGKKREDAVTRPAEGKNGGA